MSLLLVLKSSVEFNLLTLDLTFGKFELSLCLKVVRAELLNFGCLSVQLSSVLGLEVLLDSHSQDILIDWELHLCCQGIQLTVFRFDSRVHSFYPLICFSFSPFSRRNLINKSLLVRVFLILQGLMMSLELGEQFGQLILL